MAKLGDQRAIVPLANFFATDQTVRSLEMHRAQKLYRLDHGQATLVLDALLKGGPIEVSVISADGTKRQISADPAVLGELGELSGLLR